MPQDVAAPPAAHKPPFAHWPLRRPQPTRPHPRRRRVADGVLAANPMRAAAGALHAHLRQAAELCRAECGAAAARRLLAAMSGQMAARVPTDVAGSHTDLCRAFGVEVDPRTAREAVRLLSRLSALVEHHPSGSPRPSRIRLRSGFLFATTMASRARVAPRIFAPVAQCGLDGLFLAFWHRTGPKSAASEAPNSMGPIDARAGAECSLVNSTALVLRQLPAGRRWIRLAADLLLAHGRHVEAAEPGSTAHARALLVASGKSPGFAEVGCLVRGLRWLARHGFVRAPSCCLWELQADEHPDLVILGIDVLADAEACSRETARHLQRRGVVAPWALGRAQAEALRRRLWWRASKDMPSLPELRMLLGLEAHPVDVGAYAAAVEQERVTYEGQCRIVDAQWADRAAFSRRLSSKEQTTMSVWPEEPDGDNERASSSAPPVATGDRGAYRPSRARAADDPGSHRDSRGFFPGGGRGTSRARDDVGPAGGADRQEPPVPAREARSGGGPARAPGVPRARPESPAAHPRLGVPVITP